MAELSHRRSERIFVRTCVDCLAGDEDHTIADEMDEVAVNREGAAMTETTPSPLNNVIIDDAGDVECASYPSDSGRLADYLRV